jgi:serine/threonine protein kinase
VVPEDVFWQAKNGKKPNLDKIEDENLRTVLEIQLSFNLKHRIGTRGFLAPEVIFNYQHQSKAVDLWAAGVILLSFFSKRLPVFNLNKFTSIKDEVIREITPLILIFGRDRVKDIGELFGIILLLINL